MKRVVTTPLLSTSALKRRLKFAVDQGWLETNPVGRFKCTYEEPSRERLTMEE